MQAIGFAVVYSHLTGCCLQKPKPICPFDPQYTDPNSLLTIDVHAHVFNATDLQIKQFVNLVASRQGGELGRLAKYFGGILQAIGWNAAPDVTEEMQVLAKLKPAIMACDNETNLALMQDLRQVKYRKAVEELQKEASLRQPVGLSSSDMPVSLLSLPAEQQGIRQIQELPDTYDEFYTRQAATTVGLSKIELRKVNLDSVLKFVIEMFQYRFVSVYNYLDAYSAGSALKIDLLTPALVDYDWWLANGAGTKSSLRAQMQLMKEISILSGGRVHALVPFDPYRQVVHELGGDSGFSPIELVGQSIEKYGAVGVKLYPPMGFAPFSNQKLTVWKGKSWLTDIAQRSDFPRRLDDSMSMLYEFCEAQEVPIMGHSNQSNGPSDDFELLTGSNYWQKANDEYKSVSLSFGHFGGVGREVEPGESDVRGFLELFLSDHKSNNKRLYADSSYFLNLLDHPAKLSEALEAIFRYGPALTTAAIDRLMYGSDWKMLAAEVNSESYLDEFDRIISELETRLGATTELRSKFFGQNAVDFLGLRKGQRNRARLEDFYERHKVRRPLWVEKVDYKS